MESATISCFVSAAAAARTSNDRSSPYCRSLIRTFTPDSILHNSHFLSHHSLTYDRNQHKDGALFARRSHSRAGAGCQSGDAAGGATGPTVKTAAGREGRAAADARPPLRPGRGGGDRPVCGASARVTVNRPTPTVYLHRDGQPESAVYTRTVAKDPGAVFAK